MEKTLKQISDELKIDKQKVYRFVKKNRINEAYQSDSTKWYDEVAQKQIKEWFEQNKEHQQSESEVHQNTSNEALMKHLEILEKQLEQKDKQIEQLHQLLARDQELLNGANDKIFRLEQKEKNEETRKKSSIFSKIKGGRKNNEI